MGGPTQTVNIGEQGGRSGLMILFILLIGLVAAVVVVMNARADMQRAEAAKVMAQADVQRAEMAKVLAQAQAEAVRIRAQAEAERSAVQAQGLADGLRTGLPILAWLVGVAILAAVIFFCLVARERIMAERRYPVLPDTRIYPGYPALSSDDLPALPAGQARRTARRVVAGDLVWRGDETRDKR